MAGQSWGKAHGSQKAEQGEGLIKWVFSMTCFLQIGFTFDCYLAIPPNYRPIGGLMVQSPFNSIINWKANLQHINLSGITSLTNHDKHQVRESRDLVRSGGPVSFRVKDEEQSHSSGLFFPSQLSSRNLSTELSKAGWMVRTSGGLWLVPRRENGEGILQSSAIMGGEWVPGVRGSLWLQVKCLLYMLNIPNSKHSDIQL